MNVSYKREMRHNYLILEAGQDDEESFEIRMLTGNSIEGLLKFRIKQEEIGRYFYYEITSKQPLSRILEFREIRKEELSTLVVEIGAVLKRIEDYLLTESNLLLEPEHIYVEPESYQIWLCYVPGYEKSFPEAMEKLLQYLLKKTDHKDNESVVLAYRLYQESQKDYYGIEDLLKIIRRGQKGKRREGTGTEGKNEDGKQIREIKLDGEIKQKKIEEKWDEEGKGKEKEKGERKEGKEKVKRTGSIQGKAFVGAAGLLFAGPGMVWLYAGRAGLYQYRIGWIAFEMGVALGILFYFWKKKQNDNIPGIDKRMKDKKKAEQEEWQMSFEEESFEEEYLREGKAEYELDWEEKSMIWGEAGEEWNENRTEWGKWSENLERTKKEEGENGFKKRVEEKGQEGKGAGDTVLLAECSLGNEDSHGLKSVNPSLEDIVIPYFPFIIGKQEGIVDYVLKKDTISRIHLRIDEEDGRYQVTDLNSSNGTLVGDYRLEANESYPLKRDDKLTIADLSFVFY